MGVLAAKQMGAGRIIAMSRHKTRQDLALEYGATDIVSERGDAGVARIKEMTKGIGADSVLECVGTQGVDGSRHSSLRRPGSMIGYVGVPHGVELDGQELFFSQTGMLGGPAPVRRFLPHLMDLVLTARRSIPARCSTWSCRWRMWPRGTAPWTSAVQSRPCCASETESAIAT